MSGIKLWCLVEQNRCCSVGLSKIDACSMTDIDGLDNKQVVAAFEKNICQQSRYAEVNSRSTQKSNS